MGWDQALTTTHEGRWGDTVPTDGMSLRTLIPPVSPEGESWSWLTAPAWWDDAACRGVGPSLFFPFRGEPTEEAKKVCAGCAARSECLDEGVSGREFGVWGGTSERQRLKLRRAS